MKPVIAAMTKALQRLGRVVEPYKEHVCYPHICHPMNEEELVRLGVYPPNERSPFNPYLYLCNHLQVHHCTDELCRHLEKGVCPISGLAVETQSSFLRADKRTHRVRDGFQFVISNTSTTKGGGSVGNDIQDQVSLIIETLLFSNTIRAQVNTLNAEELDKEYRGGKIRDYLNSCTINHQPVNRVFLRMIKDEWAWRRFQRELPILDQPIDIVQHYTMLVMTFLGHIQHTRVSIQCVTLWILYRMRNGYRLDDVTIIPVDPYMARNLPPMKRLPLFGYPRNSITKGKSMIQHVLDQAKRRGEPLYNFRIVDVHKLAPVTQIRDKKEQKTAAQVPWKKSVSRRRAVGYGPWYVLLLREWGKKDNPKERIAVCGNPFVYRNAANVVLKKHWILVMFVGPFQVLGYARAFRKLWDRPKMKRIHRGLVLYKKYRQEYELECWVSPAPAPAPKGQGQGQDIRTLLPTTMSVVMKRKALRAAADKKRKKN